MERTEVRACELEVEIPGEAVHEDEVHRPITADRVGDRDVA